MNEKLNHIAQLRKPQSAADPMVEVLRLLERRLAQRQKIDDYYPESGPLRRELYPKHCAFFEAGATRRERAFLAQTASESLKVLEHLSSRFLGSHTVPCCENTRISSSLLTGA